MNTRQFSNKQEMSVAKNLGGQVNSNSGAGKWRKGDVRVVDASLLIECKTCTSDKSSFSIKEEWIKKNLEEAHSTQLFNTAIAFNFGPDKPNYYVINESLMKFLVEKLIEENH